MAQRGTTRAAPHPLGDFREAYPRIVTAMALGLGGLVALDGFLLFKTVQTAVRSARTARP